MKGGKESLKKSEVYDFRHKKIELQYNSGETNKRILFSEDLIHGGEKKATKYNTMYFVKDISTKKMKYTYLYIECTSARKKLTG